MIKKNIAWQIVAAVLLVGLCVVGRVAPHPANVAPVAAVALFAGFYFSRPLLALCVPMLGMLISDYEVGFYKVGIAVAVYVGLLFPIAFRSVLRSKLSAGRIVGSSVAGALVFFVISNGAVWAFTDMYGSGLSGLVACYAAALPFLVNTLSGDLFYSLALFGVYAMVKRWSPSIVPADVFAGGTGTHPHLA